MAVHQHGGTMSGGTTPVCNDCGVSLCWDISRTEYLEAKAFWDAWRCQDCLGTRLSAFGWRRSNGREGLPAEVETLLVAFEGIHPELQDPDALAGLSEPLSDEFADLLEAFGIRAESVEIANVHGEPHFAVQTDHFTIDWTAVRHDEDAPTPLVFRTTLGWPIEPAPKRSVAEMIDSLTAEQLEALMDRIAARRKAA